MTQYTKAHSRYYSIAKSGNNPNVRELVNRQAERGISVQHIISVQQKATLTHATDDIVLREISQSEEISQTNVVRFHL